MLYSLVALLFFFFLLQIDPYKISWRFIPSASQKKTFTCVSESKWLLIPSLPSGEEGKAAVFKRRCQAQLISSTNRPEIYPFHRILVSRKWLYDMEIETKPQSGTVLYSKLAYYPAKHLEETISCNTLDNPIWCSLL